MAHRRADHGGRYRPGLPRHQAVLRPTSSSRLEFWAEEGTNSGVFIRCADPEAPGAQSCYEINIFDANPNRNNATGSVVGVMAPLRVPQTELHWNPLDIEASGPQLNVSVDDERTVSVRDNKHARGRIALQRNAGAIDFRNAQIHSLTA